MWSGISHTSWHKIFNLFTYILKSPEFIVQIELTEDSVLGVHCNLVLGGITDETLIVREGDVRRRSAVTLIIRNDLDFAVLEDTDARVGGAWKNEMNTGIKGAHLPKSIPIALAFAIVALKC